MTPTSQQNVHRKLLAIMTGLFGKPAWRPVLTLAAPLYNYLRTGTLIKIGYDKIWEHHHRDAIFFDRHINFSLSSGNCLSVTTDNWLSLYKPQKGDTIIDVGAGIGLETYCFSRSVGPTGRIISIEAHPITYLCLERLCSRNRLDNVIPINVAICATKTKVFINDPESHINASIVNSRSGFEVCGVTIDSIMKSYGLTNITFIKMNIEGAERLAIEGMTSAIDRVKYICVSCHDFLAERGGDEMMRTRKTIQEFLSERGFTLVTRENDPRDWIRYQINAFNPRRISLE